MRHTRKNPQRGSLCARRLRRLIQFADQHMSSANIVTITTDNFEKEVLKSTQPVLVDFWAEWCGPCKMLTPILDELAEEYAGRIKIGKINIDDHQMLAAQYGIRSIPTLLLFNQGQVSEQLVGLRSKRELKTSFDRMAV
jgi:thioredoxin 1